MNDLRVAVTLEQCWHRVPGGTARVAVESVRAMADVPGIECVGVSAHHRKPPDQWTAPIEVRGLPLPRRALYVAWHRVRRPSVERATGPVDVIHATSAAIPPRTKPLVVTVHDLAFLHHPDHATRAGQWFFESSLELIRAEADLVVCASDVVAADIGRAGIESERIRVVPWGVDTEPATAVDIERVRLHHRLPERFVLWVGTIEPRKNLPALLEAYRRLAPTDAELVLVGPQGWGPTIDRAVVEAGGPVHRLGFVEDGDLPAIYAAAEVLCYPSISEGFGLPVLEAMAQSTPVVTTLGTATEEVAGDAAILVEPHDVGALADALRMILDDDEGLASDLAAAGRRQAEGFTWALSAQRLAAVYREAAAS